MNQLLLALKSGDHHAQKQVVDDFQVKVYNICYSMVGNRHDAEDLTQDVFIEVLKNIDKFRGESKIGTWIYRIAVNKSLNLIRSNNKKRFWSQIDELLSFKAEQNDEPFINDMQLENIEQKLLIHKAISSLPANQRLAFSLNKIDDMSYNEVAEIMNIGHSAVESLIHRAKKKLQKILLSYYQ